MPRFIDKTGTRYGNLVVEKFSHKNRHRQSVWKCVCDCGKSTEVSGSNLVNGSQISCGCVRNKMAGDRKRTHGLNADGIMPEYRSWYHMKSRCLNPNDKDYPHYGERGITICERWKTSFPNFLEDMGNRPSKKHSIDRINNDGNYEPTNCRWSIQAVQMLNTRRNRRLSMSGTTLTIAEWSRKIDVDYRVLQRRLASGWSDERVLTEPIGWRFRNSKNGNL